MTPKSASFPKKVFKRGKNGLKNVFKITYLLFSNPNTPKKKEPYMKFKILLLAALAMFFVGCAPKTSAFSIDPSWTEKPAKLTVLFTDPVVENQDDLKDDLAEFVNNFHDWFGSELAKNYSTVTKSSIPLDVQRADAASFTVQADSIGKMEVKVPKPANLSDGYTLAIANVNFSRKEESHTNQAYYNSGAAYGQGVNPGQNSMAFAGESIVEKGLWLSADYAIYNAAGQRVAFGHHAIKSKFQYAMTRSDWERCVTAFVKKSLAGTPVLR